MPRWFFGLVAVLPPGRATDMPVRAGVVTCASFDALLIPPHILSVDTQSRPTCPHTSGSAASGNLASSRWEAGRSSCARASSSRCCATWQWSSACTPAMRSPNCSGRRCRTRRPVIPSRRRFRGSAASWARSCSSPPATVSGCGRESSRSTSTGSSRARCWPPSSTDALDVDGFLQSFDLTDAIPFSHWRDGEHARLLPNVRDALVILIDHCRRTGDFRQIETLALRLLRFDSLSEEGIRARMEARAFAGDRLTALRLFKEWKAALARQLGAVPSPLLEGMALRLRRREWERPESPDIPAVRTDQWRGRPFVGRGREYRELYEAWEGTQRGAARHRSAAGRLRHRQEHAGGAAHHGGGSRGRHRGAGAVP